MLAFTVNNILHISRRTSSASGSCALTAAAAGAAGEQAEQRERPGPCFAALQARHDVLLEVLHGHGGDVAQLLQHRERRPLDGARVLQVAHHVEHLVQHLRAGDVRASSACTVRNTAIEIYKVNRTRWMWSNTDTL